MNTPAVSELEQPIEPSSAPAPSALRHRRILAAAVSGAAGKGVGLIVNAAIVPIALHSLGATQYGILITITTTVTMLFLLDLGIANTLTNLIAEAYSRDDRTLAGQYFSTAFWAVAVLITILGLIGFLAWPFIPWPSLFHVTTPAEIAPVSTAFALAFAFCLLAVLTGLTSRVLSGYQELHKANIFTAAGSILSLAAVAVAAWLHSGLPGLVASFVAAPMAANFACLLWICFLSKPWMMPRFSNFRTAYLGKIFRSGMLFFLTQIAGLVVMNSDNLVISHFLSPAQVTPYNVTWRLTNYGSSLLSLITPALWPAYAEAFVKGEQHWMRQAYLKSQRVTLLVLGAVALVMGLTGKFIINIWAGPKAVPSTSLLVLMCIWMIIFGVTMNQSTLIGATGRVGKQAIYALVASASNLALSMWWVQTLGLTGVILGTLVSYLIFIVPFQGWQVRGILKPSQPPAPREGLNHA